MCIKIYKRCSFECEMGMYSTRSMNEVPVSLEANIIFVEHVLYFPILQEKCTTFVFSHMLRWLIT